MTTPTVRPAGPADIDELVRSILAFRDHLGAETPDAPSAAASIRDVQAKGAGEARYPGGREVRLVRGVAGA